MPIFPCCSSNKIVKNGRIHNAKQQFKSNQCDRQFIENLQKIVSYLCTLLILIFNKLVILSLPSYNQF